MQTATSQSSEHRPNSKQVSAARVRELGPGVGAEITGIDVSAGLDEAAFNAVRDALHEYSVLVLPGQQLTAPDLIVFAKRFGEMRTSFYNRYGVPGFPELSVISNILDDKGEAIGIADAGMLWHTDASYLPKPDMYTLLFGIDIPQADGKSLGDTIFASSWRAFEALQADVKKKLRGLRSVHSFIDHLEKKRRTGNLKRAPLTEKQKAELPDVTHPVVRTHPVTGRPCLYVTEGHTARIDGLAAAESDALLKQLADQLHNPAFHYRHRWTRGDLVIWDNCSVHHLAIFDYGTIPRRLHRAGILGPVPV